MDFEYLIYQYVKKCNCKVIKNGGRDNGFIRIKDLKKNIKKKQTVISNSDDYFSIDY